MRGQIGDCVTTAGRWPRALGFAACSVSVYIARILGLRGGATAVNQMKKHQGTQLVQGSDRCRGSDG